MNPAETVIATLGAFGALWLAWAYGRTRNDRDLRRANWRVERLRLAVDRLERERDLIFAANLELQEFLAVVQPDIREAS